MTKAQIRELQQRLNAFTKKYLRGVQPLIVDGVLGHATKVRIESVKYYLGYGKTRKANSSEASLKFLRALASPKAKSLGTQVLRAGRKRRLQQRTRWAQQRARAAISPGVTTYNGVPVAKWFIPYLNYARAHGWRGRVNSGWRSPAYSDSLCRRICGRPSCPGTCAGRASNHAGSARPRGALDVSDYYNFGQIMRRANAPRPLIYNALGVRDPVHFSVSGR